MKKFLVSACLALCLFIPSLAQADTIERLWWATTKSGGASGSMDAAISGVSINPTDGAIVIENGTAYIYKAKTDSAAEDDPYVIRPDDVGAGTTSWHLPRLFVKQIDFKSGTTISTLNYVNAGASTYYVYSGVTLTADMLAGGMIYVHTPLSGSTPTVIGIPAFTGSTGFFMVKDMTGGGVTVQTADGQTMYNDDDAGTAYWVNEGHSRHAASFKLNSESGACRYVDVLGEIGSSWLMN